MFLILPVIIPLSTTILLMCTLRMGNWQKWISLFGAASLLASGAVLFQKIHASGPAAVQIGNWKAPYGISFVADMLSVIMLLAASLFLVIVVIYSFGAIDKNRERTGYYPLVFTLIMGVNGTLLTGDIFNLYVWFEVMLMASFVLMVIGSQSFQLSAGIKYLAINFVASVFFVSAVGILYGIVGSLNMADIALRLSEGGGFTKLNAVFMLFVIAFSIKAALFPFFFWLPASYHTPPIVITGLFSGTLTKVSVYTLVRFYSLYLSHQNEFWASFFLVIAGLTMLLGVLMAVAQYDVRKILSFHIISQVGYMAMGMAIYTVGSLAAAIFFIVHNIFCKSSLFFAAGLMERLQGRSQLKSMGGIANDFPFVAFLFFIPALSLAGIPPLSGFVGKFFLILSGFESEEYFIIGIAIAVGVITLVSMLKIWNEACWKKRPESINNERLHGSTLTATAVGVVIVLLISVFAEPVMEACRMAAQQLLEPQLYMRAALGR